MSEQDKLLPCPFCGGSDIRVNSHNEYRSPTGKIYSICCYGCCATFPNRYTRELLVGAWNTRATPTTAADDVLIAINNLNDAAMCAVGHVGQANYSERIREARKWVGEAYEEARAAIAAIQPAIDKAVAEERVRSERLCSIYFDIAAGAIGEDEVRRLMVNARFRRLRDKDIEQGGE